MSKVYTLSEQQMRLYLFEQKRDRGVFSIPLGYKFKTRLDPKYLEQALAMVVSKHEMLRATIKEVSGDIKLFISNSNEVSLEVHSCHYEQAYKICCADAMESFDLANGPLFRAFFFETSEDSSFFYFNAHHLIWDGFSSTVFMKDLEKAYRSLTESNSFKTQGLDSFEAYTLKQKNYLEGEQIQKDLEEVKKFFPEKQVPLQLPCDFSRPKDFSHSGKALNFEIDVETSKVYEQFCADNGVTLYHFFNLAFSILLRNYSSQSQFNIGTPVLGRHDRSSLNSIGFFANTAVIPCLINEDLTVGEMLKETSVKTSKITSKQKLPFGKLASSFNFESDPSRPNFYQTFFMFQDFSGRKLSFCEHPYERVRFDSGICHSELDLWITKYPNKILGGFQYANSLFNEDSVKNWLGEFLFTLDLLASSKDVKIKELPKVSPELFKRSMEDFSNFEESREFKSFLTKFLDMKDQFPDKVGIVCEGEGLTYKEFDERSSKFASYLAQKGVVKGELVGLSVNRSIDMMCALFGILKLGCGYLPIDPKFPEDRISYMVEHSKVERVVCTSNTDGAFSSLQKIYVNEFNKISSEIEPLEEVEHGQQEQTAYIIYTSGSTGRPKGVELTIGSVSNFLLSMGHTPGLGSDDVLCAVTTLSFDIAVLELFLPLINGGKLVLATETEAKNSQKLMHLMQEHSVSVMQVTPITWRLLFKSGWSGDQNLKVLCGGEKMPNDLADSLLKCCGEVWNMYGPTETTVWSTCKKLSLNDEIITIGRPIDNTSIFILDKDRRPLPKGAVGELYIGGDGLAKGYLNSPELTQERFVENPFTGKGRIYNTGDMGRFASGKELWCLGRSDNQIKIRGHRIEPGEIEIQINKIPFVKEGVVIVREDNPGDARLVGYVITDESIEDGEQKLKDLLSKRLPPYLIPEAIVFLESFPLTPNGKIDKNSLPVPSLVRSVSSRKLTPAKTDVEKRLAKIWQEELAIDQVFLEDDFFQVGGNSLVAASVFHKISLEFKQNVDLALLFSVSNLGELAGEVERIQNQGDDSEFSNIIQLQKGTSAKKFFFFHALGGNTLNYRVFLKELEGHDVYGLRSTGVDGRNIKFRTIQEMAKTYVNDILAVDDRGPYNFIGGSLGGLLAYECACLMKELGKEVKHIVMFDTSVPLPKRSKVDAKNRQEVEKSFLDKMLLFTKIKYYHSINYIFSKLNKATPHSVRYKLIEFLNLSALRKYVPGRLDADIYLLRIPIKKDGIYSITSLGWEHYLDGKVNVDFVDAPHHEFIEHEKVVEYFGRWCQQTIEKA
ncbi:MAG: amino acid adenylation domain-containing protein [Bacteriovoracaceae bacterium]|nr:amino acid adenylation domain-containing protein [Bacteriovoracaceae bacterium]